MSITEVNGVRGNASHMVEVRLVAFVSPSPNRLLMRTGCRHCKGAASWNCGCVYPAEFGSGIWHHLFLSWIVLGKCLLNWVTTFTFHVALVSPSSPGMTGCDPFGQVPQ